MAEREHHPVFFAENPRRWRRFLWVTRLAFAVMAIATAVVTVAVVRPEQIGLPKLLGQNETYQKLLDPDHSPLVRTNANAAFRQSRKSVPNTATFNYSGRSHTRPVLAPAKRANIRAGFYVNWDPQSFFSLRDNIGRLTMVFPEWFFVADGTDSVVTDVDNRALDLLRTSRVPVLPMVSNYYKEQWNGGNVHRLLTSRARRRTFIASLLGALHRYGFAGVNIDFEALQETRDEPLVEFFRELYAALHPAGYLITMDVPPENADFNLPQLQQWCDYLVVMAYDQHYSESIPGPVAGQRWFEGVLDNAAERVAPEKLIVGLATYGYDWPKNSHGSDVSYYEALVTAKESEGKVTFDEDTYNLHYTYDDDADTSHEVYFVDAATTFNQMRSAAGYGMAGVALWRLGGEDPRTWRFFANDLSDTAAAQGILDESLFRVAPAKTDIDFVGEGEILNMVSTPEPGSVELDLDTLHLLISGERYLTLPSSYVVKKYGKRDSVVALSFDDGPDERYTPEILDILKAANVPAIFFVVGINVENNVGLLKRIYDEGHEIGNHTFTHPNLALVNPERTRVELQATRRIIESITGHSTILFRPPYNADSEPESMEELLPVEVGKEENYYTVAESIDPQDWSEGVTADTIVARVIQQDALGNIILLHDAGGDREQTVRALPGIITYFRERGRRFVAVSELMGKTRDEVMPPVFGDNQLFLTRFNWTVVQTVFWCGRILFWLFLLGIVLSIGRILMTGILAALQKRMQNRKPAGSGPLPPVSVIIPAHNEEVNAVATIRSLLAGTVKDLQVIFVDDGSVDRTLSVVREAFSGEGRVRVFTKPNGGKASALNYGIARAESSIVVCIDADTQLMPDAVKKLLRSFEEDEEIAAVAGNTKVGNERNMLTKWQAIEYITSQNFDRRAFDLLNAITVVPGAVGAFRKEAVLQAGGFSPDTLAEDCDITLRLLEAGWIVRYCPDAVAFTEAPETFRGFLRQRFRWSFGIMQSVWKHRKMLFSRERPNLGFVALPNVLLFQILLPLLSPLADLMMVFGLFWGNTAMVFAYYALFLAVDLAGGWIAFRFEGERTSRLWLLLPQRFLYRQLMYWVLLKSLIRALRGELAQWGAQKRTGNVRMEEG